MKRFRGSEKLFEEAQKIIPGGVTSARHPIKFVPGAYPIFMNKGHGSHVWDVDGNEYIDWVMSFGPMVLGHCHPRVDRAVRKCLDDGFCFTMVHPIQNELARELIQTIPCAEMAKFFLGGSDATSAAIRIARIHTGRDKVIRWGYHGWHDWCYGGAGSDRSFVGVPEGIRRDVLTFTYNDLDSLADVFVRNKGRWPASSCNRTRPPRRCPRGVPGRREAGHARQRGCSHLRRDTDRFPNRARRRPGVFQGDARPGSGQQGDGERVPHLRDRGKARRDAGCGHPPLFHIFS